MRPLPLLAAAFLVALTAAARAGPLFLDIRPRDQDGLVPARYADGGAQATHQLAMYRELIPAVPTTFTSRSAPPWWLVPAQGRKRP